MPYLLTEAEWKPWARDSKAAVTSQIKLPVTLKKIPHP